jgi:hypothetical protein
MVRQTPLVGNAFYAFRAEVKSIFWPKIETRAGVSAIKDIECPAVRDIKKVCRIVPGTKLVVPDDTNRCGNVARVI